MQKNLLIYAALSVILSAGNCKKNKGPVVPVVQGDYQPMTSGSEWNYTVTGTTTATFKLTATGTDTLVAGRTYKIFTNTAGPNEYYNKTGNDYFRYTKLAELNNQAVEMLYLKDNLAKGQSWVETKVINVFVTGFGTVPVTAQFTFTVAEKGIDHVVNGVTFKDAIKLTAVPVFSTPLGSITINASDLQYFYARKVGLINSITVLRIDLASINVNTETKINAYTIK